MISESDTPSMGRWVALLTGWTLVAAAAATGSSSAHAGLIVGRPSGASR